MKRPGSFDFNFTVNVQFFYLGVRMIFVGQFLAVPVEPIQMNILQSDEFALVFGGGLKIKLRHTVKLFLIL